MTKSCMLQGDGVPRQMMDAMGYCRLSPFAVEHHRGQVRISKAYCKEHGAEDDTVKATYTVWARVHPDRNIWTAKLYTRRLMLAILASRELL